MATATDDPIYLHIGCGGGKLPGFINVDVEGEPDLRFDLGEGLPFPPGSVQGIFSEHFIERLDQPELLAFLRDCRRVLADGGRLRLATPDLDRLVREYLDGSWREQAWLEQGGYEWVRTPAEYLNVALRERGRAWLLNPQELTRLLMLAGFDEIQACALGDSADPHLRGLETGDRSFVLEARRSLHPIADEALVSIVIPAYRPDYLEACLRSALEQTYPHIEILVLDDSGGEAVERITRSHVAQGWPIRYLRNATPLGEPANLTQGIRLARGELIKPLYDDDLLLPDAIARLVAALRAHPEASLAVCRRLPIDAAGRPLSAEDLPGVPAGLEGLGIIRGERVIGSIVATGGNWVGEPTVMLFRRMDALAIDEPDVMSLFGRVCSGIGDVCLAMHLLGRGELAYVPEPLARVRVHAGRTQNQPGFRALALETWRYFRQQSARLGFVWNGENGAAQGDARDARGGATARGEASAQTDPARCTPSVQEAYSVWRSKHSLQEIDAQLFAERMMLKWRRKPLFHVLVVLREGEEGLLADTLDALAMQLYHGWRLTVVAPFSAPDPAFGEVAQLGWMVAPSADMRAAAVAEVAQTAGEDWVWLLPAGSRLEPHALLRCGDYIDLKPEWRLIYSDDDVILPDGTFTDPRFKPDFNLDLLRSMDYIGACLVQGETLLACAGPSSHEAAFRYDLTLRVLDAWGEPAIGHIADVLVHLPPQTGSQERESHERQALMAHLARQGIEARVEAGFAAGTHRVIYQHAACPLVSIIIPNRDKLEFLEPCVESVLEKTAYRNYEILIVDNQSTDPDVLDYYAQLERRHPERIRLLAYDAPFNFAAMNNLAAAEARGEYLLLLNNDIQIVQDEWLDRMLMHGQRPDVGVVGARLVYPETGKLQHAGIVLGLNALADHPFNGVLDLNEPGYMGRAQVDQNYSALTAACLLVRKSVYESVGGMDERNLPVLYNDVDLCLKIGQAGFKIVWTPYATVVHHGSTSLKGERKDLMKLALAAERAKGERAAMMRRWMPQLANDPAYNRHLSLLPPGYGVEATVVIDWDTAFHDRPRILGVPLSGGSGEYRVIAPFRALSRAGLAQCDVVQTGKYFQTRLLTPIELERADPDTLLLQNALDDNQLEALALYREFNPRVRRMLALDDLLTQIPRANSFYRHAFKDAKPRLRKALALCDRVIVSTEPLAELCRPMIGDVWVIPNRLERHLWGHLQSRRRDGPRPRIGWAGAQQHAGDLALIEEVVKATAHEADWVFFGMCPESLRPYVRECHDFVPSFYDYPAKLASLDLDLAVAPLEINAFNEAKSNLRLLEYGILGWPVVCTDIYPYQNAPVKRVPNEPAAWIEAIRERLHDPEAARREGEALRAWVLAHFILEDHLDAWLHALTR